MPKPSKTLCILKTCSVCHQVFFPKGRQAYRLQYCQEKCRQGSHESGRQENCLGCGVSGRYSRRAKKYRGYCVRCMPVASKSPAPTTPPTRSGRLSLGQRYLEGDYAGLMSYLEGRSTKTELGCWEWNGKVKSGYGELTLKVDGKSKWISSHRLALECKLGRPFVEHAHHICANSLCCNPDHLELATHNENIAEMLARQSFIKRIAELEAQVNSLKQANESLTQRVADLEASVSRSKSL